MSGRNDINGMNFTYALTDSGAGWYHTYTYENYEFSFNVEFYDEQEAWEVVKLSMTYA